MNKLTYIAHFKKMIAFLRQYSTLVAALFFLVIASYFTFPFVSNPLGVMTAPIGGDVGNSVIQFDSIKQEHLNPFIDGRFYSAGLPEGIPINVGVNRVSFFSTLFLWTVTSVTSAITAHSLMTFLGYFLTGFITFLFIKRVTKSAPAGIVAGCIYSLFPHLVSLARAAPPYTHMWLFVLPLWAFWNLLHKGVNRKRLLLVIGSILPAMFWTPYYAFHVLLVGLACITVAAIYLLKKDGARNTFLSLSLIGIAWIIIAIVYRFIGLSTQFPAVPTRTLQEAYDQSAHPLMYVLPGAFTTWGSPFYAFLTHVESRATDTNLYIGISCIILSSVAVYFLLKRRLNRELTLVALLGISIVVYSFMFSLAPTVHVFGVDIPTPNKVVVEAVPALRAGQRLVMPLMSGIAVLASIGLFTLLKNASPPRRYIVTALVLSLVITDLSVKIPHMTTTFVPSYSLKRLSSLPSGLTAQYYKSSLVANPQQYGCLPVLQHHMPLLNDCALNRNLQDFNTPPPTLASVTRLPLCDQPARMKEIGVKYVLLYKGDSPIKKCLLDATIISSDNQFEIYKL